LCDRLNYSVGDLSLTEVAGMSADEGSLRLISARRAADMASVLISQHNQLCRTDRIDLRSRFVLVASGKREVCYQGGSLLWPGTSRSWNTSRGLSVLVCEIVDAGKG
jgi:hypothetical protein